MALLTELGRAVEQFMNAAPEMPAAPLYVAAVAVPTALLHERAHALVAARRHGRPLHITLGSAGKVVRIQLRRLRMAVSALPHPTRPGGYESFEASRASAHDLLLVALAGPAASLLGFLVSAVALSSVPHTGTLHNLLWAAVVTNLAGVVVNILPLELQERREGPKVRTDARVALEAIRASRAFRACERSHPTAIPGSTST